MFTSATNKRRGARAWRCMLGLSITAVLCVTVSNVYALFGHGVRSNAMDFMFLYPLGGAVWLFILAFGFRKAAGRLSVNLLNSGVAALSLGAMFRGILEIAGGSSGYGWVFDVIGWSLAAMGIVCAFCSVHLLGFGAEPRDRAASPKP